MPHTPGPWMYDEESNEVYRLDSAGHVEACLCEIRGEPNWRDNARLIAAAPDLLSELQRVQKILESYVQGGENDYLLHWETLQELYQPIGVAIRKAIG